eukprot:1745376-Pleurochrysis_carterae.AAC.1
MEEHCVKGRAKECADRKQACRDDAKDDVQLVRVCAGVEAVWNDDRDTDDLDEKVVECRLEVDALHREQDVLPLYRRRRGAALHKLQDRLTEQGACDNERQQRLAGAAHRARRQQQRR